MVSRNQEVRDRCLSEVLIEPEANKSRRVSQCSQEISPKNPGLDLSWDEIMRDVETIDPRLSDIAELTSHSDHE